MGNQRIKGGQKRKPIYGGIGGSLARVVDGAIGVVAPRLAHQFRVARMKSEALLAYEAARVTRTNPVDGAQSASADAEILHDLRRLRDLSRSMVRDDPHAATTMNIHDECIVGEGIRAQASCTPKETGLSDSECEALNESLTAEFARWADEEADVTQVGTFYDLQSLALRGGLVEGDGFGHCIVGNGRVGCEMIDADRIESPGLQDTNRIRGGVELGTYGERVAFHILPNHPDDSFVGASRLPPVRTQATDGNGLRIVQHFYKRTRAGQTRGVPILTPAILTTRNVHHYLDSELIAARAASNFALFIKRNVSNGDADIHPVQDSEDATGQQYHEFLEPGLIEYLNEGEEPVPFNPNRPGSQFAPFVERLLRATAASTGLSYEIMCRDIGRMNLSSARAMMREIRRGFDQTRARMVRQFCRPWYENVIRSAAAAGRVQVPARWLDNQAPFLRCQWVSPIYGMVDPETDIKGSVLAVDANLSDQFTEAQRQGRNASDLLRTRARFYKEAAETEIEFGLAPGTLTKERPARTESSSSSAQSVPGQDPNAPPPAPGQPVQPPDPAPADGTEDPNLDNAAP